MDWESIKVWTLNNRRVLIYVLLVIVLVVAGLWVWQTVDNWWFKNRLEKSQANVNALVNKATEINGTIANLKQQEFEAQVQANTERANVNAIRKEIEDAQKDADQAIDNVNAVNNGNFNGVNTDDANAARCRAFPNSADCRR
jgi:predicted negative regulator of RcsB-dependent stress response